MAGYALPDFDADMRPARGWHERPCDMRHRWTAEDCDVWCTRPLGHYGSHAAHHVDDESVILTTWKTFDGRIL